MTVNFLVRTEFKDGSLAQRMTAEGLPTTLKLKHTNGERIERVEYECSSELCLALMRAGCDMDITQWDEAVLDYVRLKGC